MAFQPNSPINEVLKLEFLIDGINTGLDTVLLDAAVHFELNKVPFAKFTFLGSNTTDTGEKLPSQKFKENQKIEFNIKVNSEKKTLFNGIIKAIEEGKDGQKNTLKFECKDASFHLTLKYDYAENNDQSFDDKVELFTKNFGITNNLTLGPSGEEKITHDTNVCPWDYIVGFADSIGIMLAARNGEFNGVNVLEPDSEAKYFAENGSNIFSFSGKTDDSKKVSKASIEYWDSKSQKTEKIEMEQSVPDNPKIVKLSECRFLASTIEKMVKTFIAKGNLASVYGKVLTFGNLSAKAGDYISFNKTNEKIDNTLLLISQEVHTIENGYWKTEYAFGIESEQSFTESKVSKSNQQQTQTGQTNSINGLQIGVVTQIEEDPNNEFRIRVRIPILSEKGEGVWARLATLNASKEMGSFFIPSINDEVIVGCLGNNPDTPIVLGSLYSSANPMPFPIKKENYTKGFVTKEGTKVVLDDEKKTIELSTKKGNKLLISDDEKGFVLEDENKNKIIMNADGITLQSNKDIILKATGNLQMEGLQSSLKASGTAEIKGALIQLN
jgi:phage baseplate assembly protein gpV